MPLQNQICPSPDAGAAPAPLPLAPLKLTAAIDPMVERCLQQPDFLFGLTEAFGTPLNLVFPDIVAANLARFHQVYERLNLRGRIYATHKPNKSSAIIRRLALTGAGVDIASERELEHVLTCGFSGDRIEATGPKNLDLLTLCLQHGVTINVDNFTELQQITTLWRQLALVRPAPVMVRLCGFCSNRLKFAPQDATLGVQMADFPALLDFLTGHQDALDFRGFSYHYSGASENERLAAMDAVLDATRQAMTAGLNPRGVDFGGGYKVNYLASQLQWEKYKSALRDSVVGDHPSLTWNDSGLGYRNDNGRLHGAPAFIEHYTEKAGADELYDLLMKPLPGFKESAATIIRDLMLELYIEPGRALHDQAGITVTRVNFVKTSPAGATLVGLDMNRTNLNAAEMKLMSDPVIIRKSPAQRSAEQGVYYLGNLCLPFDLITYHKSFPDALPEPGDLVAFINTGAYLMDFAEAAVLQQRVAEKVALTEDGNAFRFARDSAYRPLNYRSI